MNKLQEYNQKARTAKKMPELSSGDIVRVFRKIKEGNKERIQIFEGIVISVKGRQSSSPMITVRRVAHGMGVEITVPLLSPAVEKIEKVKKARTRKSKLYYLREKGFKLSKLKMKDLGEFVAPAEEKKEAAVAEPTEAENETSQAKEQEIKEEKEKK